MVERANFHNAIGKKEGAGIFLKKNETLQCSAYGET